MRERKNKGETRMKWRRLSCAGRGVADIVHSCLAGVRSSVYLLAVLCKSSSFFTLTSTYATAASLLLSTIPLSRPTPRPGTMSTSTSNSSYSTTATPSTAPKKTCHNRRVECCTLSSVTYRICGHTISYKTQYCDGSVCGPNYYSTYQIISPDRCEECDKRVKRNDKAAGIGDGLGNIEMAD